MALSRSEQEISIVKSANEKEFSLYVTDPKFVRKMKKNRSKPIQTAENR